jgi:excinuclease ABC subunit C
VFKGKKGQVLYVGKARSLRARVRQYFSPGSTDYRYFIPLLERTLGDIETVVTATEKEAVLLENSLIKEHKPRYNVRLRDDKDYLSVRLDSSAPWPRLEVVRRPVADGAEYFGPYPSATDARRTLNLAHRYFQLRTCDDDEFAARTRPCLEYQIKRCPGPCVLPVERAQYETQVQCVSLFLRGKNAELVSRLEGEMRSAARALDYERAARLRDQVTAVQRATEAQRVAEVSDRDRDVFGLYREGDTVVVTVLLVRDGFVRDTQTSVLTRVELPDDELVAQVIRSRYEGDGVTIPDEVVIPIEPEGITGVSEWLGELRGRAVAVAVPQRGSKSQLLAMAQENAQHAFREKRVAAKQAEGHAEALAKALGLERPPVTIECVDISHHAGDETVGAIVCLRDGVAHKERYRGYHVRTEATGNDFNAMREVLSRRFRRAVNGEEGWEFPDLFVVDGGRGQLGIALEVLRELEIKTLVVCALAKERESVMGEKVVDRVYLPGRKNPVTVRENGPALVLLARARDEAHRFANKTRERLLRRKQLRSELDALPGIGTKLRVTLLRRFGSVSKVAEATLAELTTVLGATRARGVYEHFNPGVVQLPDGDDT